MSLARSTQRRNPRGLSGKDGRPQIYLCRGAKLRCRHFWQAGLAQSKHPSVQGRPGVPSSGQRCRLPTADCSTILGVRLAGPRNHANVKMRRSWCGQNQEKLQWKVKRLQNLGARVVRGNPTPPVTAKRPLAGSELMDTTGLGAITPTQVQDNNQGPTHVSLSPRSQRMDTLRPPQSPVLADVVAQLQALMASVQSIATTVGQLGGQLHVLQTEVTVMKNANNEDDEFKEHCGFSSEFGEREGVTAEPWRAKIRLCQTYAVLSGEKGGAVFKASRRVFVAFSSFAVLSCSTRSSPTVNISQGFARMVEQFSEECCLFFVVSKGFGAAFTSKSLLAQYRPGRLHVTAFKEHGPVIFTSGRFGAVFVNLLFAQYRPGWMHLPATANYPRVMCLKSCLCLLLTGVFEGNSENRWLFFVVSEGCGVAFTSHDCVCVLAFRPTTDPRHRHPRTCAMTARCAGKKRTRRPCHRRSRRVSPFIAVRVGEATHPGPLSTKHLRCPHCPTWLVSQKFSTEPHPAIPRAPATDFLPGLG